MRCYLDSLQLPDEDAELRFILGQKLTCYSGVYPYKIFPSKQLERLTFGAITIFYGGNGSGKTTLLQVLASAAGAVRRAPFAGGPFFEGYVAACRLRMTAPPQPPQLLTSDDVTDWLLDLRCLNNGLDRQRDALLSEYGQRKYASHRLQSLAEYDDWRESAEAKRLTKSRFVRQRVAADTQLHSNGESAMHFFVEQIGDAGLYLLDEPENSLSAALQLQLRDFLAASARLGCQLVLASHSPILLSLPGARVYDLDAMPAAVKPWHQLENVRLLYQFFQDNAGSFEEGD